MSEKTRLYQIQVIRGGEIVRLSQHEFRPNDEPHFTGRIERDDLLRGLAAGSFDDVRLVTDESPLFAFVGLPEGDSDAP